MVSSSNFLNLPCAWSIMNVVLSNFQIKIVALSVLMVLSPTVALSNNTHYMDGNVHEIGNFSTNKAFYVQNNTTVSAKDIEATVKVGVEGGSSLTANSIKTNTFFNWWRIHVKNK